MLTKSFQWASFVCFFCHTHERKQQEDAREEKGELNFFLISLMSGAKCNMRQKEYMMDKVFLLPLCVLCNKVKCFCFHANVLNIFQFMGYSPEYSYSRERNSFG
jgi:hypothetical protein